MEILIGMLRGRSRGRPLCHGLQLVQLEIRNIFPCSIHRSRTLKHACLWHVYYDTYGACRLSYAIIDVDRSWDRKACLWTTIIVL